MPHRKSPYEVTPMNTGEIVLLVVYILGTCGLGYWISALKGAVSAQEKTIVAQGESLKNLQSLLQTMQIVLESTDAPKMLERFEAYRKLVDEEKAVVLQQHARRFDEEKKHLSQSAVKFFREVSEVTSSAFSLIVDLMLYAPPELRKKIIDSSKLPPDYQAMVHRSADAAPDLSLPENRRGLLALGLGLGLGDVLAEGGRKKE